MSADVDTKSRASATFGNDLGVDTKSTVSGTFGNYSIGFIRVHRRKLAGRNYGRHTSSASYDLVRAVRVDGKPHHKFVLGLGSIKQGGDWGLHVGWFWSRAFAKMHRAGLSVEQQHKLADEMVRKGAPRITVAQCEEFAEGWPRMKERADNIATWAACERNGQPVTDAGNAAA